jgi:hypothetical protein
MPTAAGHDPRQAGPLADDQGGERHHRERGGRLERGGEPTGEPVRREEEQREEHADVAQAQEKGPPPPRAGRQSPGHREEHQAGRQRPQGGRQQRPVRREEALGDQVRRTPGSWCEGGEEEGPPPDSFHGN